MLAATIAGTDLATTIASIQEHPLAAEIIVDHNVDIGADGEVVNLPQHAGKVEFHQVACTIVHLRDDTGQIHTTFEVDHQYFDGKVWNYRTAADIAVAIKTNLDALVTQASKPLRNPGVALLVDAVNERTTALAAAKAASATPATP